MSKEKVLYWSRDPRKLGGYICMPMKENVPNGRKDWTLTTCPECGAACWRRPSVGDLEKQGCIALCTKCALEKGAANGR